MVAYAQRLASPRTWATAVCGLRITTSRGDCARDCALRFPLPGPTAHRNMYYLSFGTRAMIGFVSCRRCLPPIVMYRHASERDCGRVPASLLNGPRLRPPRQTAACALPQHLPAPFRRLYLARAYRLKRQRAVCVRDTGDVDERRTTLLLTTIPPVSKTTLHPGAYLMPPHAILLHACCYYTLSCHHYLPKCSISTSLLDSTLLHYAPFVCWLAGSWDMGDALPAYLLLYRSPKAYNNLCPCLQHSHGTKHHRRYPPLAINLPSLPGPQLQTTYCPLGRGK